MSLRAPAQFRLASVAALAGIVIASVVLGRVTAQNSGGPPAPTSQTNPPRAVRQTILPYGSIQRENADGTRQITSGAQSTPSQQTAAGDSGQRLSEKDLIPETPPSWLKDESTDKAFLTAMREYYAYKSSGLQHRSRVFEWQLFSSKLIFLIVLMLVSVGVIFAALQFRAGLRRTRADARDAATAIDVSTGGIKVSSPVLGVIILVISLAFFYLYLVYVYPISEIV